MKQMQPDPLPSPLARFGPMRFLLCLMIAVLCVTLTLAAQAWFRTGSSETSRLGSALSAGLPLPGLAADDSLHRRLLQATVCIAPQGGAFRGCGVLVDKEERLVVTVPGVMGDREDARTCLAIDADSDKMGTTSPSLQAVVAGRVVHREVMHGLILIRLERLPDGAAPLPLGEWSHSPGRIFNSLHSAGRSGSFSRARIGQILMPPHY